MSSLSVYHQSTPDTPNKVLTHLEDIGATLQEQGVRFARWQAGAPIQAGASDQQLIGAYQASIDALKAETGYARVEVSREADTSLRDEHTCGEERLHFFAAGRGLVSLRIEDYIYAVLCEKGDLIGVPAGVRHWFDMGEEPRFVAIRVFNRPEGGLVRFTGDSIAKMFPRLDD
ncbi:acireductone dioxygenase [Pseudomonas sp. SORT22]|uniref:acireductone dioxygenase n=1 Tax=unclassified Pseudomonas TaxID=196821 RepID=UPI0008839B7E|nr:MULTISPECIES: acireductone dioxygenase [unclassified Pseudomonas]QVM98130.1 acireductone dioxygenase [Pseudomonas sp. SORT22]SDQ49811.1 acireductone dioxygenase apoprotein [Pseudomonas sp. UC 17F4]